MKSEELENLRGGIVKVDTRNDACNGWISSYSKANTQGIK